MRALLTQYLGTAGKNVQLLATEFNSVYSDPGKQTTSLVNGLWLADSLGALLETPYDGADVWDLRNSYESGGNDSSSLYGWRQDGDYGLIGSPDGSPPASGTYVPYPTYFAEELASKIVQAGGNVVQATSSDPNLTTYAVLEANGQLDLLVINKSATSALTGQFQLANYVPATQATVWQYGEAQDTAQSESATGASALANFTTSLTRERIDLQLFVPRVLDDGARARESQLRGVRSVDYTRGLGHAQPGDRKDHRPVGVGDRSVGHVGPGLHLDHDGNAAGAGQLQCQRHQCRTERDRDLFSGGLLHVPGDGDRPERLRRHQQRDGRREPVVDDDQGQPRLDHRRGGRPGAIRGIWLRPVRQPHGNAAGPGVVGEERIGLDRCRQRALHGPLGGRHAPRCRPPAARSPVLRASPSRRRRPSAQPRISTWSRFGTAASRAKSPSPIRARPRSPTGSCSSTSRPRSRRSGTGPLPATPGTQYVIDNAGYNSSIAPGQSVTFGFLGSPGGVPASPTNYTLNGKPIAGAAPPSAPIEATVTFTDADDWGSGFTGDITITNTGTTAIIGWTLSFNFAVSISSIWNASIVSQNGNMYTLENAAYNAIILPGQSVTIGFNASPGKPASGPTNYLLNGVPVA